MKKRYTARIYYEDGSKDKAFGNSISALIDWMHSQSRKRFTAISGEIVDSKMHQMIKSIQYSPIDEEEN